MSKLFKYRKTIRVVEDAFLTPPEQIENHELLPALQIMDYRKKHNEI